MVDDHRARLLRVYRANLARIMQSSPTILFTESCLCKPGACPLEKSSSEQSVPEDLENYVNVSISVFPQRLGKAINIKTKGRTAHFALPLELADRKAMDKVVLLEDEVSELHKQCFGFTHSCHWVKSDNIRITKCRS